MDVLRLWLREQSFKAPLYIKIDTYGKWLRCLRKGLLCKSEKLKYMDNLKISEPVQAPDITDIAPPTRAM